MNQQSNTQLQKDLQPALKQLCNQTNLRIISLLYKEKMTMGFIVRHKLGISSQLTSKRLKSLINVDLIIMEKVFKRKIYRLNTEWFVELGLRLDLLLNKIE